MASRLKEHSNVLLCVTSEFFHCSYNRDISFTVLLLLFFLLSFYVIFLWYVCLAYGPCA